MVIVTHKRRQEYMHVADYPNLFRMWIDVRRKPILESKVEAFGTIDIWSLPGMKYIQNTYVTDLIYDLFPIKIDISDPSKFHDKSKGVVSKDLFGYLNTKDNDQQRLGVVDCTSACLICLSGLRSSASSSSGLLL